MRSQYIRVAANTGRWSDLVIRLRAVAVTGLALPVSDALPVSESVFADISFTIESQANDGRAITAQWANLTLRGLS
jgi:hypothetical protein